MLFWVGIFATSSIGESLAVVRADFGGVPAPMRLRRREGELSSSELEVDALMMSPLSVWNEHFHTLATHLQRQHSCCGEG
eukprot:m.96187 g.96187  ORF g.96187 m.96187 type:complete len:80 (-) comp13066_c0_seq1:582-821(-)